VKARALDGALLLAALALAALLRAPCLALPHDRGDQLIWAGVAANIHERGRAGYTVRGLAPRFSPLGEGSALVAFECVAPPGALLEDFKAQGEGYWDAAIVNQPPAFFAVLLASHAVLGKKDDGFPLVARDPRAFAAARASFLAETDGYQRRAAEIEKLPEPRRSEARRDLDEQVLRAQGAWERALATSLVRSPPRGAVRAQLWATLPVLLADLGTLVLVFVAARALGGRAAALVAALAWATDPLALYCSERILSNAPLAAASAFALALEALVASRPEPGRRSPLLAALVGLACAAAIAVKVSAVFLIPAIAGARWLRGERGRELAAFLAAALAPTLPWWALNTWLLGHPFGLAWRQQAGWLSVSAWGRLVTGRGPIYYATALAHSPLVVLGIGALALRWDRAPAAALFVGGVLLAAARFDGKEARHLLLAYPPLVVAGSVLIARLATRRSAWLVAGPLIAIALAWQASYGLELALDPSRAP